MADTLVLIKQSIIRSKQTYAVTRESLGGYRFIVRPDDWPTFEELSVRVIGLTKTELDTYLTFINGHQGQKVELNWIENPGISGDPCVDNNQKIKKWLGYITSPVINNTSKKWRPDTSGNCSDTLLYNLNFKFQGNLVFIP